MQKEIATIVNDTPPFTSLVSLQAKKRSPCLAKFVPARHTEAAVDSRLKLYQFLCEKVSLSGGRRITSVVKIGFITSLWHAIFVLNDDDLEECFEALRNECGL